MDNEMPSKPKFYLLAHVCFYVFVVFCGVVFKFVSNFYWPEHDFLSATMIIIPLTAFGSPLVYSRYKKAKSDYDSERGELDRIAREHEYQASEAKRLNASRVNENIRRFVGEQNQRKLHAKWWQVWI